VQNGATVDAGLGTVAANGVVSIQTTGGIKIAGTLANNAAALTATPATGSALTLAGIGDTDRDTLRLREFSARARVDASNPVVTGFVLKADVATPVLIRAIGPTLGDLFSVSGALTNPKIDVYRGSTLVTSNVGWTTAANPNEIALGGAQSGAFPLRAVAADSAVQLSLAPGAYTAVMSSASGASAGIGLAEVYDLSAGSAGQRLINLSTRGPVGNGGNALLMGFVVGGNQPKRVLIRGVGPGLAAFGVTGAVTKPVLTLYRGTTQVAQNTGWSTSADSAAITAAGADAGAFAFAANSADSAVVLSLAPGLYTAQLTSLDGVTGTGLIEIYELP
jgi:hypothetical protein